MTNRRSPRSAGARPDPRAQLFRAVFIVTLVLGLFIYITEMARLTGQAKEINQVNSQIHELSKRLEERQVRLSMCKNLEEIQNRAVALGMQFPEDDQIRVISVPGYTQDAGQQTAENTTGEKLMR